MRWVADFAISNANLVVMLESLVSMGQPGHSDDHSGFS